MKTEINNEKSTKPPYLVKPMSELLDVVKSEMSKFPEVVALPDNDEHVIKFFLGKVMKETNGYANPAVVTEFIKKELKNE